jgi:adenylate kinase
MYATCTCIGLPVQDPNLIFESVWKTMVEKYGEEKMNFPRDILWLAGAPGSGKGHMTKFIMSERGISAPPIETRSV